MGKIFGGGGRRVSGTKTKILGYCECSFRLLVLLVFCPDCVWYVFVQPMLLFLKKKALKGMCWHAVCYVVQYIEILGTTVDK